MAETKRLQSKARNRRDKENELIEELSSLLPLEMSHAAKLDKLSILRLTMAYLKCRKNLETDRSDVRECLASDSSCLPPSPQIKSVPLAMLDNDGALVAGTLVNPEISIKSSDIALPDFVLAGLEQSFLTSDSGSAMDVDEKYEKLEKYKEGLERGMRAFLSQSSASQGNCCTTVDNPVKNHNSKKNSKLNTPMTSKKDSKGRANGSNNLAIDFADAIVSLQSQKINEGSLMLEAVPGLFLILDKNKKVLFVSENIKDILGVNQMNVIGDNISSLVYEKDYPELEKQMCDEQFLADKDTGVSENALNRTFYLAMNYCFQKPKSRQKNTGQKLFRWDAKLRLYRDSSTREIKVKGLFSICRPVRDVSIVDFQSCEVVFFSRHGMDYKCIYIDHRIRDITGYNPDNILGTDGFSLKHPCDVMMCHYKHKTLVTKGRGDSGYYRLLGRNGKWMWAVSYYTVTFDQTGQPIHVDATTYIASMEEAKCVMAREKADYQRMKNEGFDFDLTYYGLSQPTLATLSNSRKTKRKKPSDPSPDDHERMNKTLQPNVGTGKKAASQSSVSPSGSDVEKAQPSETSIELSPVLSSPKSLVSEGSTCSINGTAISLKGHSLPSSLSPLYSDTSLDMMMHRDHCSQNASSSSETDSVRSRDGNESCNLSHQPEPFSPSQLSLMDGLDFSYSPLPSVDFNSPNIDLELLMSNVSDEDMTTSGKAANPLPASASHEDYEVQSILSYFMPGQQETKEDQLSSVSGVSNVSEPDLTTTDQQNNGQLRWASTNFKANVCNQWTTTHLQLNSENQVSAAQGQLCLDNVWAPAKAQTANEFQWPVIDCLPSTENLIPISNGHNNSHNEWSLIESQPYSDNQWTTTADYQTVSESQWAVTNRQARSECQPSLDNQWAADFDSQLVGGQPFFGVTSQDSTGISPCNGVNGSNAQIFPDNAFPGKLIEIETCVTHLSLQQENDQTFLRKDMGSDDIYTLGQCYSHITDNGGTESPEAADELLPFGCNIDELQAFLESIDQ